MIPFVLAILIILALGIFIIKSRPDTSVKGPSYSPPTPLELADRVRSSQTRIRPDTTATPTIRRRRSNTSSSPSDTSSGTLFQSSTFFSSSDYSSSSDCSSSSSSSASSCDSSF